MDNLTPVTYTLSVHEVARLLAEETSAARHGSHARIGQAVHRRLKRTRHWRTEIRLTLRLTSPHATLDIQGRLDALEPIQEGEHLIECKSTRQTDTPTPTQGERLQLQLYALMRWRQTGTLPARGSLLYLNPDHDTPMPVPVDVTEPTLRALEHHLSADLHPLFDALATHRARLIPRLRHLPFPKPTRRAGQGRAMRHTYRRLSRGHRSLLEAPTGTGKTLAVMYPALRATGRRHGDRIVYLSARRSTRQMVSQVLAPIARQTGLRILTLEAQDRLCDQAHDTPCDCDPAASALQQARSDALKQEAWHMDQLVTLARSHRLCPHRFIQHLSDWADVLIGDYHHVFAPRGGLSLKPFGQRTLLLIDEAHNLHERLCEHLTCELSLHKTDPWRTLPLVRAIRRLPAGAWHRLSTLSTRTLTGTTELLAGWLSDWLARWTQPGDLFQDTRPEQAHLNTLLKLLTLLEQPPETLVFQH
ncbi:MAG: DEAD/DEAH box helicase, partial [Gammaproteobacteria bacterium]